MGISMEERMHQLSLQKNTKGIGENSVNGGRADNRGENSGVMKSGDAVDSGNGNGSVNGGSTLNMNINKHNMRGGIARNDGLNNGEVVGGNSTNHGLNNNALNGGSATNEFGSVNHENSHIKGGNAIRELQRGLDEYNGMQKQLAMIDEEVIKKNNQLSELQKQQKALGDQADQSDETKQRFMQIEGDMKSLKDEVKQTQAEVKKLNVGMDAQRVEIAELKTQFDKNQEQVKKLGSDIEKTNADKEKLKARLEIQEARNKKQAADIAEINTKIEGKKKEIDALKSKLESEGKVQTDTNPKILRLERDVRKLEIDLDSKSGNESKSKARMDNLEARIRVLEVNEKTADLELKDIKLKHQELTEKFAYYEQTIDQDIEKLGELEQVFKQIGELKSQGEGVLAGSSKTTTMNRTTVSYSRETKTPSGHVSAGFAQNLGDNSGSMRGGDSISNSYETNINNEMNLNNEVTFKIDADQTANKIAEGASAFTQTIEEVVLDAGSSVKGAVDTVSVLVSTKTPYQVW